MGADIHLEVQERQNGVWGPCGRDLGPLWVDPYQNQASDPDWWEKSWAGERNYDTFARLAGVRNRGRDFTPLFAGRGIPEDVDQRDEWLDLGDHSQTWATFAELRAADFAPAEDGGFAQWVRSPEIAELVAKVGGENLRVLIGFDS